MFCVCAPVTERPDVLAIVLVAPVPTLDPIVGAGVPGVAGCGPMGAVPGEVTIDCGAVSGGKVGLTPAALVVVPSDMEEFWPVGDNGAGLIGVVVEFVVVVPAVVPGVSVAEFGPVAFVVVDKPLFAVEPVPSAVLPAVGASGAPVAEVVPVVPAALAPVALPLEEPAPAAPWASEETVHAPPQSAVSVMASKVFVFMARMTEDCGSVFATLPKLEKRCSALATDRRKERLFRPGNLPQWQLVQA